VSAATGSPEMDSTAPAGPPRTEMTLRPSATVTVSICLAFLSRRRVTIYTQSPLSLGCVVLARRHLFKVSETGTVATIGLEPESRRLDQFTLIQRRCRLAESSDPVQVSALDAAPGLAPFQTFSQSRLRRGVGGRTDTISGA
jgi:hypothetical protein